MNRKSVFDAVRRLFGSLNQNQVNELDRAIDNMVTGAAAPTKPPLTNKPYRNVSARGIKLIHSFEGCVLTAYPDPGTGGKPWTIGWGSTTDEQGRPILPGTVWTQRRADERFMQHLAQFESEVSAILDGSPTTQHQYDALVSFAYNLGSNNLAKSTLMRLHKKRLYHSAAKQFVRWNRADGQVMNGLTRRRKAEAELYLEGL